MELYYTETFTQGRNCVRKKNQGGNGAKPHWACEHPIHIILIITCEAGDFCQV